MEQNGQLPPTVERAAEQPPFQPPDKEKQPKFRGKIASWLIGAAALAVAGGLLYWAFGMNHKPAPKQAVNNTPAAVNPTATQQIQGIQLDESKDYGNKYANGILPVGDGKYSSTAPKTGYIYACQGYANNLQNQSGGAGRRGPWFISPSQYNLNQKTHVRGAVKWQASFSNTVSGSTRTIITNDLPNHTTGVFPISPADPAYDFDRNPNSIKGQNLTYALSVNPVYSSTPTCESGQVGIMLTGVTLFDGLDAGGRDAGVWEVQDSCEGHPQKDGIYHYHTLSACIKNISVHTVIGFALDGYPITGPQVGNNNYLTTYDLDECHGLTSQVALDGKNPTTYHYVMTQDYPYSISCYRGTPIQPPGQASGVPTNHP